ncbi:YheV family putative zinc ribbon protein [Paraglaciecola sp. Hal342]
MTTKIKKRFIAGATCSQCKSMDTLMLYFENNVEKMECVQCHYQQTQTDKEVTQASRQSENVIGVFKPE